MHRVKGILYPAVCSGSFAYGSGDKPRPVRDESFHQDSFQYAIASGDNQVRGSAADCLADTRQVSPAVDCPASFRGSLER